MSPFPRERFPETLFAAHMGENLSSDLRVSAATKTVPRHEGEHSFISTPSHRTPGGSGVSDLLLNRPVPVVVDSKTPGDPAFWVGRVPERNSESVRSFVARELEKQSRTVASIVVIAASPRAVDIRRKPVFVY